MDESMLFPLALFFGGFFLFFIILCCIRLFVCVKDDTRLQCFKSKEEAQRRRRIQLSLLPEVNLRSPVHRGYTPPPDDNINEDRICSGYIYEDGRSIGLGMLANHLPTENLPVTRPINRNPNLSHNVGPHTFQPTQQEPPPPDYSEVNLHKKDCIEMTEPPPPRYDECMKLPQEEESRQ